MEATKKRKKRWGKGQGPNPAQRLGRPRKRAFPRQFLEVNRSSTQSREVVVEDDSDYEGEAHTPLFHNAEVLFANHEPTAAFFGKSVPDQSAPTDPGISEHSTLAVQTNPSSNTTDDVSGESNNDGNNITNDNGKEKSNEEGMVSFLNNRKVASNWKNPFNFSNDCCNNCRRRKVQISPGLKQYNVQLHRVNVSKNKFVRKFANVKWKELVKAKQREGNQDEVDKMLRNEKVKLSLCQNCKTYLTGNCDANEVGNIWPAMIWSWLTDTNLLNEYGILLWGLVPDLWRPWWIDELQESGSIYNSITLSSPRSVLRDVTLDKQDMERAIAENNLTGLRDACNKHMLPLVKCPWGCTHIHYKCNHKELDVVVS